MLKATTVLLVVLALPLAADASTLYRCVDEFGHATYTNYKSSARKCNVLSQSQDAAGSSSAKPSSAAVRPVKASPADFPKVSSETQKSRDNDRRYILEQELTAETQHLDEARKSLATQLASAAPTAGTANAQPIRDRIALHERNLDALRREISNLR